MPPFVRRLRPTTCVLLTGLAAGCSSNPPPPATPPTPKVEHGHSHDRGKMMLADAGKYHAALTAHLSSQDGNELDVFLETADDPPKPVAVPVARFTAKARRDGDDKEYDLTFEPAPAEERPAGEKPGTCSHFVAKAPWMKPEDVLTVTAEVEIDGRVRRPVWKRFVPSKYAHHQD